MLIKLKKIIITLLLTGLVSFSIYGTEKIHTEYIKYNVDGQNLVGYLAYDESSTNIRPGILVVHEWVGLNDYAKKRAVDLAKEGYVAFALDMYGDGKEVSVSEARKNQVQLDLISH